MAIAYSDPGLRIAGAAGQLKPVARHPNEALFMLSSNFQLLTSKKFHPSSHDVIQ